MEKNVLVDMEPSKVFGRLLRRVPLHIKVSFVAAFGLCILVHFQAFSDMLLNLDNIGHMFGSDYGTASGRWLLPTVLALDGNFSTSWIIGLISALLLSVSVCFTVTMLRIRSVLGCVLAAALMVTFPTVTSNNFYLFSADAYMLSLALACIGAYVTAKHRLGFIGGAVAMTLSMGIYQSYFCVGAALLVGSLIFELLDGEKSVGEILKKAVKYLLTMGLGLAAYYIIVKLTSQNTGLVDYMGISQMGSISLGELPTYVRYAYINYYSFFIGDSMGLHNVPSIVGFAVMMVSAMVLGVMIIVRRKLKWKEITFLAVLAAMYPLAGNLIWVMAPDALVHILMQYGLCLTPVFIIGLADTWAATEGCSRKRTASGTVGLVCVWTISLAIGVVSLNYAVKANEFYFKSEMIQNQSIAFGGRLLLSAQQAEDYEAGMPLVLSGTSDADFTATSELDSVHITGAFDMSSLIQSYTYGRFLRNYCGWTDSIFIDGHEVAEKYSAMPEVELMPIYPTQGSVKVIDGAVVVKLS